ncbi:MAG: hypothetical protein AAF772_17760 [Acidobacteriota bacterium]
MARALAGKKKAPNDERASSFGASGRRQPGTAAIPGEKRMDDGSASGVGRAAS